MARFPVYTKDGDVVHTTQDQSAPYASGSIERQVFVVDTSGGAIDYLVPFDPASNYRVLSSHFHLANGPAASYVGVEVRAQGPWGIAEIFKNRRTVTASRDPEGSFVPNGAGGAVWTIANVEAFTDVGPDFVLNTSMLLYMNVGAGQGGYVSVLLERVLR